MSAVESSPLRAPEDAFAFASAGACACGHAALAAALGKDVSGVMRPFVGQGLAVSSSSLRRLAGSLARFTPARTIPEGMSMMWIQGVGSWQNHCRAAVRNSRSHWVAVHAEGASVSVYDLNENGWRFYEDWEIDVLKPLLRSWKTKDWRVLEILRVERL